MNDRPISLAFSPAPFDEMEKAAKYVAESKMFGIDRPAQAMCLFGICQSEGIHYMKALQKYHLIEGRPSMKADYMLGELQNRGGAVIFYARTDAIVAGTLFADKSKIDDAARARGESRFNLLWTLESEEDPVERGKIMIELSKLAREGEETLIRTFADSEEKHLSQSWKWKDTNDHGKGGEWKTKHNWLQSPRQMLTARFVTEGTRVIDPGLIAGIYPPDEIEDIRSAERLEEREFLDTVPHGTLALGNAKDLSSMKKMLSTYEDDAKAATGERKRELQGLASEIRCKIEEMEAETPPPAPEKAQGPLPVMDAEPELVVNDPRKEIPWRDYILQHVSSKSLRGKKLGSFSAQEIKVIVGKTKGFLEDENEGIRLEAQYIQKAHDELSKKEDK